MATSDDKPPEKFSPFKQFWEDISWDITFFRALWNLLLSIFYAEGKAVKAGWFAYAVFMTIAFWGGCHYSERHIDEKMSSITNYFNGELGKRDSKIDELNGRISAMNDESERQDSKIQELTTEKESAENKLTFFEANPEKLAEIYSNIFARTPTSFQQFDSMVGQFSGAISNLSEIESETKELQNIATQSGYTSNQLADLGIEKLPDGRTQFGGVITGSPKVIMEALNSGFASARSNDFHSALSNMQTAIMAFEATKSSGAVIDTSTNLTATGKAAMYGNAGEFAMQVASNDLAIEYLTNSIAYANQALKDNPGFETKWMLVASLADLGNIYLKNSDFTNSFESFRAAITNYESINLTTNFIMPKTNLLRLYGYAAFAALRCGETNEFGVYSNKRAEIWAGMGNHTSK
jgi:tetratricopeptide (TPR) repeat protein